MTLIEFFTVVVIAFLAVVVFLLFCYVCCEFVPIVKSKKRRPLYTANIVVTGSAHSLFPPRETANELRQTGESRL